MEIAKGPAGLPVLSPSLVSQLQITKHLVNFIAVAGVCMDFFRKQLHEAAILRQLAGEQLRPVQRRNPAIEIKPIFHGIVVPVQQGTLTNAAIQIGKQTPQTAAATAHLNQQAVKRQRCVGTAVDAQNIPRLVWRGKDKIVAAKSPCTAGIDTRHFRPLYKILRLSLRRKNVGAYRNGKPIREWFCIPVIQLHGPELRCSVIVVFSAIVTDGLLRLRQTPHGERPVQRVYAALFLIIYKELHDEPDAGKFGAF